MKTPRQPPSIRQQLNAIYPPLHRQAVVSSASRALIEEALCEDRGLGAGRQIAVVLSLAAVISALPAPALATLVVSNGQTANNKILAGVHYSEGSRDYGSINIYSGGLATNTTIHSGGNIFVSSGGNATSSTINFMGAQHVSSGGSASFTTLNRVGEQYIDLGGRTSATTINSGGKEYLDSGGQAIDVIQNVGGNIIAPVYGGDTQTVANGSNASGSFSLSNGSANGFILYGDKNWFVQEIFSGGIATNTTLSGGSQDVNSGGSASNTSVHSGGVQTIAGGNATSTSINSGGRQQVIAGGSATNTTINNGGVQIASSGSLTSTTINSGGVQGLLTGGAAANTMISGGGYQIISSGGSATSSTIQSGGLQDVSSGGSASSTIVSNGGRQQVYSGASTSSTTISAGGLQLVLGSATTTTISGGGAQLIFDGGNADSTTIQSAGQQHLRSGGSAIFTTINNSGGQIVSSGGNATSTTIHSGGSQLLFGSASGTTINSGGLQNVLSGGSASESTINSGGWQEVFGGNAASTTINHAGKQSLIAGGSASATLISGGSQFVQSGGSASATLISSGGQFVSSGGSVADTTIHNGGKQVVSSGGSAATTSISSGGEQQVFSGGSASNTTISGTGGKQVIYSGGGVSATSISSGGLQQVQGSANSTLIYSGGTQVLFAGGQSTEVTQNVGGNVNVTVRGDDTSSYVSGTNASGGFSLSNGSASGFILYADGVQKVAAGGHAIETTINSGGEQTISSGGNATSTTLSGGSQVLSGSASDTTIDSGGEQTIYSTGSASATTLNDGRQTVNTGGSATATTLNNNNGLQIVFGNVSETIINSGMQQINGSGSAINTTMLGGTQRIMSGGTATNTTIQSAQQLIVDGGNAISTTINNSGLQLVSTGGNATSTTISGGSQALFGSASDTTIDSGGLQNVLAGGRASESSINSGGTQIISSGGSAAATSISSGGEQQVISGASASNTTIGSGGVQQVQGSANATLIESGGKLVLLDGGQSSEVTQNISGNVNVTVRGGDTSSYVSGTNASGGFSLSNGSASGFILYTEGVQKVAAGGHAIETTINSGGEQTISSGGNATSTTLSGGSQVLSGSASDTTINSGGEQHVSAGGSASATTVNNSGWQGIYVGGSATSTTINSGGEQQVLGSATATSIRNGGSQHLDSTGTATDTNVQSGGTLFVDSGGLLSGTLSVANGGLLEGSLTFTNGSNLLGHILITDAASLQASVDNDTLNLAGSATQLVYAQTNIQTLNADLSGAGELIQQGSGTLTLTGNNSYTGTTTVSAGTLVGNIASGTALNVSAGARYEAGAADRTLSSLNGAGTVDMQNHNLTASSGTFSGTLTGTNDLTKTGSGTLSLATATNLAGDLKVNAGTLELGESLMAGGIAVFASHTTLDLAGSAQLTAGNVTISDDTTLDVQTMSGSGPITIIESTGSAIEGNFTTIKIAGVQMSSNSCDLEHFFDSASVVVQKTSDDKIIQMSNDGLVWKHVTPASAHGSFNVATHFTLTDSLSDNTTNSAYAFDWDGKTLTKTGEGTLTLTGNNTYTGATVVNAGRLKGHIAVGTALSIAAGAAYDAGDEDHSIGSLNGEGNVDMHDHNLTVGSGSFNGTFTDTHDLIKTGSGTLTLNTDASLAGELAINAGTLALVGNTHAEALALNAGTLALSENKVLSVAGTATLGGGSTLDLASHAKLVAGNVAISSGAALDIEEQAGATPVTIIEAINAPISGNFGSIFVAGVAIDLGNPTNLDHFLKDVSVQKTSGDKVIQLSTGGLLWSNTEPASAHGTFNVATHFTLSDSLSDNTTNSAYAFGWDGKTLTKLGDGTLILTGTYTYTGETKIEAGTLVLDGQNGAGSLVGDIVAISGTAFQIINSGHFTGSIDPTDVTLSGPSSSWDITGASVVDNLSLINGGNIAFAAPTSGNPYKTLLINGKLDGNGTLLMNTHLAAQQGDLITVHETAGTHTLTINDAGGIPSSAGQSLKLIDVSSSGLSNGTFTLSGGHVDAGAFRYLLTQGAETPLGDAGDWYLYSAGTASRLSEQSLAMAGSLKYTALASLGTLQERLGELRLDEQNADKNDGKLWLRTYHQDYDNHLYAQAAGRQKISGLMLGIDKRLDNVSDAGRVTVGAFFGAGNSDFKAKEQGGQISSTDYQLGAYATWLGNQGSYVDLVARTLWLDRDYRFDQSNAAQEKASGTRQAYSFTLELGHRMELNGGWFAQPQTQLSWLRSQKQELITDRETHIALEQSENLDLRTGLMVGKTVREAAKAYQFYGKLDRLQTLRASNNVTVNETRLDSRKESAAWNVGTGIQFSSKTSSFHLDLETGLGSPDVKQKWGINFGVRWVF